jgi:hypothetical protein
MWNTIAIAVRVQQMSMDGGIIQFLSIHSTTTGPVFIGVLYGKRRTDLLTMKFLDWHLFHSLSPLRALQVDELLLPQIQMLGEP